MQRIRCQYQRTLFRNEEDGYTIFSAKTKENVQTKDKFGNIICEGYLPLFPIGVGLVLNGDFINRKKGTRFHARNYRLQFDNEAAAIAFLSSHTFDDITPATAEKIVKEIGSDVFAYAATQDAARNLCKSVKGLDVVASNKLISRIREMSCMQEMILFMLSIGGGYINAEKICKKYGEKATDIVNEDPYRLLEADIPFETCEALGRKQHIPAYAPERVAAIVWTAILQNESAGNTRVSFHKLCKMVHSIERRSNMGYRLHPLFIAAELQKSYRYRMETDHDELFIYRKNMCDYEETIAREIGRIQETAVQYEDQTCSIAEIEADAGIKYEKKQRQALELTSSSGIKILTGGPGTGKTTTINGIIRKYLKEHPGHTVRLCAPTGCAVRHMEDSTSMQAETIHRMLDVRPYDGVQVKRDEYNRIDADFVIVDEASMIDTEMFALLLKALKNGVLLLLVGDKDQLPSVGAGNILRDLITSKKVETYELACVFRQKEGGTIIANSYRIKNGDPDLEEAADFEIRRFDDVKEMAEEAKELMAKLYDVNNPGALRVFTPVRKRDYEVGSINMNTCMKNHLLDIGVIRNQNTLYYGAYSYNEGDIIVMTRNNRKQGYYNGDEGVITKIYADDAHRYMEVKVHGRHIRLSGQDLGDIELAYAMTAHKSQGGECETSVIIIPKEPRNMLDRSIIYVEATRAKKKNIVLIEGDALEIALQNSSKKYRETGLLTRMERTNPKKAEPEEHRVEPKDARQQIKEAGFEQANPKNGNHNGADKTVAIATMMEAENTTAQMA